MSKLSILWDSLRVAACDLITNGEHSIASDGDSTRKKCRICGVKWTVPPPLPPVPDPPAPDPDPEPPTPPVDPAAEPDPSKPGNYRDGFLWKPVNESGGPLVVLCPPAFTGHIKAFWLEKDDQRIETGLGSGVFNGGRYHVRYSRQGAAYPAGVEFHVLTDGGVDWYWTIPRPGSRYDGQIVPSVAPSVQMIRFVNTFGLQESKCRGPDAPEPGEG